MSYEEIDKSVYGTDVFTSGAKGRYAKPEPINGESSKKTGEKKKRTPKVTDELIENGQTEEVVKTKKKSRKVPENGEVQDNVDLSQLTLSADGETVTKPKKKRAPKAESNIENIDPSQITETEPTKKKKAKAPKVPATEDNFQMNDSIQLDLSTEMTPKVKKPKKHKTPKTTDTLLDGTQDYISNDAAYPGLNEAPLDDGIYGSTFGEIVPYDVESEPIFTPPERSDYELGIINAYNNLASKMNFGQFFGDDQWIIKHMPKSGRPEPRSRIRKMLPGSKDEKPDGKSIPGKQTNQKGRFLNRLRTGVNSLVRDESNMLFGEQSKYELNYYDDETDNVDTDDLHRYAQKLRELEDTDREVNPEFLVLRDGKTVYAVHEADEEGKMTLSTRKPIYDRYRDQAPDDERGEKKKLLSRLKNPFGRNKEKHDKRSDSLKPINPETPDSTGKRKAKKTGSKTTDDDNANIDAFMD